LALDSVLDLINDKILDLGMDSDLFWFFGTGSGSKILVTGHL